MSKSSFFSGTGVSTTNTTALESSTAAAAASESAAAVSATSAASSASSASANVATNAASAAASEASRVASVAAKTASETAETNAETAESAALVSKNASAASAVASESSKVTSVNSASTATTKASEASTSETNSAASAATATSKAADSETARAASVVAKDAAVAAKDASVVAKDASVVAKNASVAAQAASETAETNSETAETNSANSATASSNSATASSNSATASEASKVTSVSSAAAAATSETNAASSETNAAASYDLFDDRMLGARASAPTVDNDGNALIQGTLYFDTSSQTMKVYGSSGWVPAGSSVNGTAARFKFIATNNQTTFSGSDANSQTLGYDAGFLDVYLSGLRLVNGTDFTATTGTNIVLAAGAATGDILEIVAYGTFVLANFNADQLDGQHGSYYTGYTDSAVSALVDSSPAALNTLNELAAALGDDVNFSTTVTNSIATKAALAGATFTGEITANGGIALPDDGVLSLGDSDELTLKHHNSGYSHLINTTGTLYVDSDSVTFRDDDGSPSNMVISQTGIDVTGSVTADGAVNSTYFTGGSSSVAGRQLTLSCEDGTGGQDNATHRLTVPSGYGSFATSVGGSERMRISSDGTLTSTVAGGVFETRSDGGGFHYKQLLDVATAGCSITGQSNRGDLASIRLYQTATGADGGYIRFDTSPTGSTTPTERMRISSSGNLLVGKTSTDNTTAGTRIHPAGYASFTIANDYPIIANRLSSDGDIAVFRKDGTTVGSIGSRATGQGVTFNSQAADGVLQNAGSDSYGWNAGYFYPRADNTSDLGLSILRFDDIYATNGTIQTSDRNEKQDIAELADAEQRVAVACKGLLRKFRWKDSVAEKGDEARTHFGIIAQDLQAAFAAEGLDAGDYAMFISSTWWETQTEVDSVEAVEATEDTEAVEAKDAYTRTDTFYTLAEAPTGATERTRLGVRYPELLAFIISAI